MEWICPHCQTELATPGLSDSAATAGPTPEQAYARCFQCSGYAVVERKNGKAEKIEKPAIASATTPHLTPLPPLREKPPRRFDTMTAPLHTALISTPKEQRAPTFTPLEIQIAQEAAPSNIRTTTSARKSTLSPWLSGSIAAIGALAIAVGVGNTLATPLKTAIPEAKRKTASTNEARANAAAIRIAALPKSDLAVTDSLRSAAMAPTRHELNSPPLPLELQARVGIRALELRSGPGSEFPLMGLADLDERYTVVEWKSGWFKISLEGSKKVAWVAKHQIELFTDAPDGR